jgi:tRNA modification GTPase
MWDLEETICAVASPAGAAMRGVVRISGPNTAVLLQRIVPDPMRSHFSSAHRARAFETVIDLGTPLGLVETRILFWPSVRSYTGQPSAEIHLIGAAPLLQATMDCLHTAGARLAGPGEFTLRSFLAGRIDLTQAEAVLGVIDADSRTELGAALDQLTGGVSEPLTALRKSMIDLLADVEAGLDFVDEDIQFIENDVLALRLDEMSTIVQMTVDRMSTRGRSGDLPLVVLSGRPNAGKSRLLNALAGFETAIVSDVVGTTRDPVEVRVEVRDLLVRIVDTAGIEELTEAFAANGSIVSQAQTLGQQMAKDADLRLWCSSLEFDLEPPPKHLANCMRIATKCDLLTSNDELALAASLGQYRRDQGWLEISSATGQGLEAMVEEIALRLKNDGNAHGVSTTAARCRETLTDVAAGLASAAEVTRIGGGHELVSAELRLAMDAIGRVTGAVYTDDILDSIFSRFCIGK